MAHGLTELEARVTRQATATWGAAYLEDSGNNYIWQPESVMYSDAVTGHECWVLARAPSTQDIIGMEHASRAWSYNGQYIGFWNFSDTRDSLNPALGSYQRRWIVAATGSTLRALNGAGRRGVDFSDFNWANTELAYYSCGRGDTEDPTSSVVYKTTISAAGLVTAVTGLVDTASKVSGFKYVIKEGVDTQDHYLYLRSTSEVAGQPNTGVTSYSIICVNLQGTPAVLSGWGVGRLMDEYGNQRQIDETGLHDEYRVGDKVLLQYNADLHNHVWWLMDRAGSASDGGPAFTSEEVGGGWAPGAEIIVVGDREEDVGLHNPYGLNYLGHPAIDRWGHYGVVGDTTDENYGTHIIDFVTPGFESSVPVMRNYYDGTHHSWTGFTDWVIGITYPDNYISCNIYTGQYNDANYFVVCNPVLTYTDNYNAYPRPSQSPDGTKIAFAQCWMNGSSDDYPYIAYAVAYFPHPPKVTGASKNDSYVRLAWDWDDDSKYTTRGFPDESTDPAPDPKETRYYHVWVSTDHVTWTEATTTGVANGTETYDYAQPNGTTRYYAVTQEEWSGLESHTLSNVWQVTLDGSGNITTSAQYSAYPTSPKGDTNFWTTAPGAPTNLVVTTAYGGITGHNRLTWTEPSSSKKRYYNIYYSTSSTPAATQANRIASVPAGTTAWLDWCADTTAPNHYYRITTVDRLDNEGTTEGGSTLAQDGSRYYWRIRSRDENGVISAYSPSGTNYFDMAIVATGAVTTGAVAISATATVTRHVTAAITVGAVGVSGSTDGIEHIATGAITTGAVTLAGASLMAPTALYCNDSVTGAQGGDTNPVDIVNLDPVFSAIVSTLGPNITGVKIRVSAKDDQTFTETLTWESGWITVNEPAGRIDDIVYGSG